MKNAVIIHGKANKEKFYDPALESPSNASWLPWLQKQLLMQGILAQTPEMPKPYEPDYLEWAKVFEQNIITPQTLLVGHSCGAGFLVRWLSEHIKIRVDKVVLVAPWIDPDKTGGMGDFFDFTIDPQLAKRAKSIIIFNSNDDFSSALESAAIIRKTISEINYREFDSYGHFTRMKEFPELRDALIS